VTDPAADLVLVEAELGQSGVGGEGPAARAVALRTMADAIPRGGRTWTRDELYDRCEARRLVTEGQRGWRRLGSMRTLNPFGRM
jgi:hypothetical protein